jgi:hypothetical protein
MKDIIIQDKIFKEMIDYFSSENKESLLLGYINDELVLTKLIEIKTSGNHNLVLVTPELQIKFMKSCIINKKTPVIIHNHLFKEDLEFSEPDISFLKKFCACYKKIGGNDGVYGMLFNNESGNIKIIKIHFNATCYGVNYRIDMRYR